MDMNLLRKHLQIVWVRMESLKKKRDRRRPTEAGPTGTDPHAVENEDLVGGIRAHEPRDEEFTLALARE